MTEQPTTPVDKAAADLAEAMARHELPADAIYTAFCRAVHTRYGQGVLVIEPDQVKGKALAFDANRCMKVEWPPAASTAPEDTVVPEDTVH